MILGLNTEKRKFLRDVQDVQKFALIRTGVSHEQCIKRTDRQGEGTKSGKGEKVKGGVACWGRQLWADTGQARI
jgi:hypothetical protein